MKYSTITASSIKCFGMVPMTMVIATICMHITFGENRELCGRVLDSRPRGRGFEPHRRHCVVVLEQDTFILA